MVLFLEFFDLQGQDVADDLFVLAMFGDVVLFVEGRFSESELI